MRRSVAKLPGWIYKIVMQRIHAADGWDNRDLPRTKRDKDEGANGTLTLQRRQRSAHLGCAGDSAEYLPAATPWSSSLLCSDDCNPQHFRSVDHQCMWCCRWLVSFRLSPNMCASCASS